MHLVLIQVPYSLLSLLLALVREERERVFPVFAFLDDELEEFAVFAEEAA
jgi:hypothetical protein